MGCVLLVNCWYSMLKKSGLKLEVKEMFPYSVSCMRGTGSVFVLSKGLWMGLELLSDAVPMLMAVVDGILSTGGRVVL